MPEHLENQNEQEAVIQGEPSSTEHYLTLESGGPLLFLSTKYVTEIINGHSITHLPLVPPLVRGIINLRGQTLPIVNIRVCMDKPEAEYTNKTCIAILNVDNVPLGVVVNSVRQVMDISLDYVRPIPLKRQQKLPDGMIMAENGSMLMSSGCASLTSCRYQ